MFVCRRLYVLFALFLLALAGCNSASSPGSPRTDYTAAIQAVRSYIKEQRDAGKVVGMSRIMSTKLFLSVA